MLENVGKVDVATIEKIVDMATASFPYVVADMETSSIASNFA